MSSISSISSNEERYDLRPRKKQKRLRRVGEKRVEDIASNILENYRRTKSVDREPIDTSSSDDEEYFLPERHKQNGLTAEDIASSILNDFPRKEIVGREKESLEILSMILQPREGVRPLLIGPRGVGKESLVSKVSTASALKNRKIVMLDCHELIAGPNKDLLETFKALVDYTLSDPRNILYLQNIEKLVLTDSLTEYAQTLFKRQISLIGSISEESNDEKIHSVQKLLSKYSFVPYLVKESPIEDVQIIVKNYLKENPVDFKVEIEDDAIDCAIKLAAKYEQRNPFPMKAIQLIQGCVCRYLLLHQHGKVTQKEILEYVSSKAKISASDLMEEAIFDEKQFIRKIRGNIVGQDHAIQMVADRICSYRLGLLDCNRPWGVFLFVGSTGVGKTELSKNIADFLFNDKNKFIRIDGSEYKESHTVSNLIGAPLGYEGNEIGGLLTEPLLQDPKRVVLIDELEKAHPDVQKLLLQILDSGSILDRRGKRVDCSQAIFIMTSNIGSDTLFQLGEEALTNEKDVLEILNPLLVEAFTPELCNRFNAIVPFQPLNQKLLPKVTEVHLHRIKKRLQEQAGIDLEWTEDLVSYFGQLDFDFRFGMRGFCRKIDNLITSYIRDIVNLQKVRLKGKIIFSTQNGEVMVRY
ncbi:MAG: AAA family ATPase [Waddliaceae bacterium]